LVLRFGITSDLTKKLREFFFKPIAQRSNAKPTIFLHSSQKRCKLNAEFLIMLSMLATFSKKKQKKTPPTTKNKYKTKQTIKKTVNFSCFVFQVQLLLDIENSLPLFILKRFQVHSYSECPNAPKSVRTKVSYKSFLINGIPNFTDAEFFDPLDNSNQTSFRSPQSNTNYFTPDFSFPLEIRKSGF